MEYQELLKRLRVPTYVLIEEFEEGDGNAWYKEWIAMIDTTIAKNDIILWFPKQQNGVFLKDFVAEHPKATYHSIIPGAWIV